MLEYILLDLDDTILDFKWAENQALTGTLTAFGIEPTEYVLNRYHLINKSCWERLEKGELTREQVVVRRYELLFEELGYAVDKTAIARNYERLLGIGHWYLPGAEETVKQVLFGKYRLFL